MTRWVTKDYGAWDLPPSAGFFEVDEKEAECRRVEHKNYPGAWSTIRTRRSIISGVHAFWVELTGVPFGSPIQVGAVSASFSTFNLPLACSPDGWGLDQTGLLLHHNMPVHQPTRRSH
jgi:hypothetical protein